MSKSKILLLMTGSIAAYKVAQVISRLIQNNCEVQVVASKACLNFIGAPTLEGLSQKPVVSDLFENGRAMDHIHLVRWADVILVAPASANFINKIAAGVGDDLLTTMYLAHDFQKPFLVAPAMNTKMYLHPATQKSISTLKNLGVEILETASGVLACGEVGWGRLLEPDLIVNDVLERLRKSSKLTSNAKVSPAPTKRTLVTYGGSIEKIDAVRSIHNTSTGKTGAKIASGLLDLGMEVSVLRAQSSPSIGGLKSEAIFTDFKSFQEQLDKILSEISFDMIIHSAALSDYSVVSVESSSGDRLDPSEKISSEFDSLMIGLKKNPKLIDSIRDKSKNKNVVLVGFKLTHNAKPENVDKLVEKQFENAKVNFTVHNDTQNITDEKHIFTVFDSKSKDPLVFESAEELTYFLGAQI